MSQERDADRNKNAKRVGGNGSSGNGASDLLGLFAPPPPVAPQAMSLSRLTATATATTTAAPSERDPLVPLLSLTKDANVRASSFGKIEEEEEEEEEEGMSFRDMIQLQGAEDLTATVRRINHQSGQTTSLAGLFRNQNHSSTNRPLFGENTGNGQKDFLKKAGTSSQQQKGHSTERGRKPSPAGKAIASPFLSVTTAIRSVLAPFALPSTWMGGILFVLYHVVFCMANGGAIIRPYSESSSSLLGDTARYTAVGIIASCPFLVYVLSDREGFRIGLPALYPSTDLFLAPFLAEAAAIIDKTIVDDWRSGKIVLANNHSYVSDGSVISADEELLTELWFGSFALVVSFGMFAAGSLLILASKIKLANLGTYLPYGVLCGFFSAVGVLMWKLAITIDTPTLPKGEDQPPDHWLVILIHHLPSLLVGIAMNRLGPKHPFFVTGLILLTIVVFYGFMMISGIPLEEAQANGWFYSHNELQSAASSSLSASLSPSVGGFKDSWWHNMLPPVPFGTWFALFCGRVHWRAVIRGTEHMIALAILYLLRASIHAAALKKNVHNLVRRVPIETKLKAIDEAKDTKTTKDIENNISGGFSSPTRRHKRNHTSDTVSSTGLQIASDLAQYVLDEVQIVKLSLADGQSLSGKCYDLPYPPKTHHLNPTSASNDTVASAVHSDSQQPPDLFDPKFPVSNASILPWGFFNGKEKQNDEDGDLLLLRTNSREVSGLTQRIVSHRALIDVDKNSFFDRSTSIGSTGSGGGAADGPTTMDYVEIHAPPTDLTLEEIFFPYGYGMLLTGVFGGFGCCPQAATSNIMYAIGADKPAPQYFSVILLLFAFYSSGFELVRFIPKAAFSSLLVLGAVDSIVIWFLKPISKMNNLQEWSVVPFIAAFSLLVGMLNAIVLGIGLSTFLFVADFFRVSVVKYDASGLEIRSRIERSLVQSVWLDTNGDVMRVLVLQNYLFFGNASSVLWYIETMFEDISKEESVLLAYPIPPFPIVLVLDLSLITGMDTSAVDVFMDIWRICKANDCKLYLCGLSPRLKKTFAKGGIKPDTKGPRKSRTLLYFSDLDHGLGRAEDVLIDMNMGDFANQSLFRLNEGISGFHIALQHIDQLHSTTMAEGLLALEPHTRIVTLEAGQILHEKDGGVIKDSDHGLFFIESGMIRQDDDRSNRTNTRTGGSLRRGSTVIKGYDNTLRGKHARLELAAKQAILTRHAGRESSQRSKNLRISTAGPGWVVGANEFATGQPSSKKFKAITKVRMHHLRFSDLTKIEEENPALVLRLYKMLTYVMARKEEDTVGHLSTLHDILSSPAHSRPIPRLSLGPFSQK